MSIETQIVENTATLAAISAKLDTLTSNVAAIQTASAPVDLTPVLTALSSLQATIGTIAPAAPAPDAAPAPSTDATPAA